MSLQVYSPLGHFDKVKNIYVKPNTLSNTTPYYRVYNSTTKTYTTQQFTPVKRAFVYQDNAWKLFYGRDIIINVTPDEITSPESSVTIKNKTLNSGLVNYPVRPWYNLNWVNILTQLGLYNSSCVGRNLVINLYGVWIGGKMLKYPHTPLYKTPACDFRGLGTYFNQLKADGTKNTITIQVYGDCRIQGFGGNAINRVRHIYVNNGGTYWPYTNLDNDRAGPFGGAGTLRIPKKDFFGVDATFGGNDYGWNAHTDTTKLMTMQEASKYIDFDGFDFDPTNVAHWDKYIQYIGQYSVVEELTGWANNLGVDGMGAWVVYADKREGYDNTPGNTWYAQNGAPWNGGHALLTNTNLIINNQDSNSKLKIISGCGGGQVAKWGRTYAGSGGGVGLPGGKGCPWGYDHKYGTSQDFDEAPRPAANSDTTLTYSLNYPPVAGHLPSSYETLYAKINQAQSGDLNVVYAHLYGRMGYYSWNGTSYVGPVAYGGWESSFNFHTGAPKPCIVGNLNATMHNYAVSKSISTPGLAVGLNGATITTTMPATQNNLIVVGPRLYRGNGDNASDWQP